MIQELTKAVQEVVRGRDDLLRPQWRRKGQHPLRGHCYVASEALWHLLGGRRSDWTPCYVRHEGGTHWYLRRGQSVLDPTRGQFKTKPPYQDGVACGFLTQKPSRRAKVVLTACQECGLIELKGIGPSEI